MKKILFAVLALGLLSAVPASAQSVRVGPGGVTIRTDDDRGFRNRGPDRRMMERRERRMDRRERRMDRRFRGERCRMVTTRIQRPNGSVVVRRQQICR